MNAPLWIYEAATHFWAGAGGPAPYPRSPARLIPRALPASVWPLSHLHVRAVDEWLARRFGTGIPGVADRPLRACLVARGGHGFIFVDGEDPDDEQRFSVAHELAHFLCEYWRPRARVDARLGREALAVIDGLRAPTQGERIRAVLKRVDLEPRLHLMERTPDGHSASAAIDEAEREADRLAFELLAPAEEVLEAAGAGPSSIAAVTGLLVARFGLPFMPARCYAAWLVPAQPAPSRLLRRLIRQT